MAITLKDIAETTGLSRQTVAFILGDRPHLFREETRRKVIDAAQKLGYRPNSAAASMSPSVPMRSMLTCSPSNVTTAALLRFDEPRLMLTARFICTSMQKSK